MEPNGRLRLATFNLKHGALADKYRGNPDLVAEACVSLNADVLALQEVDTGVIRSKRADLAQLAAEASGMQYVPAQTMKYSVGGYGNALLVRGEIEEVNIINLMGGPRFKFDVFGHKFSTRYEPRNAIMATVCIGERKLSVAATHLSTERNISCKQLTKIMATLACQPQPQILMGDLNRNRREVLSHTATETMTFADGPPTFPATDPKKTIDHIAVNGLTICSVIAKKLPISDHLALIAEVE